MNNILAFLAETNNSGAAVLLGVRIALATLILVATAFIIYVVMKQSGNSDGMEAMSGAKRSEDSETYYGKNAGSRKEARLKKLTYIAAGVLAVCCIVFILLQGIF